ncbi:MAG: transporter related [Phycisphaerales bacterium]|nr:transporter related [Phycisphaerales bacterium]
MALSATENAHVRTDPGDLSAPFIVSLEGVRKTYGSGPGAFTALHELSLRIPRGRTVALLGRRGSGKSTLLNLLGAVDRPTTGAVRIGGVNIATLSDEQLALFRRRRLGFVFQSFHLVPSLTVFDNIAVPWVLDRKLSAARRQEIESLLARLGLADKSRRYPDELSGGQQQRVALARAVIHRPELVLADEPTGNLDAQSGRVILDLLVELQNEFGVTVVMATHSEEAAGRCGDRVLLDDGRVVGTSGAVEVGPAGAGVAR